MPMKFSRNPKSGQLEIFTDEGIYVGAMATMGDFIGEQTGRDGGPGSGNFGHSGRPGKIGGSASEEGASYEKTGETANSPKMKETETPLEELSFENLFSDLWNGNEEEDPETKEKAKAQAEQEAKERQEREEYGQNGLTESEYPEELRLTKKERDAVYDVLHGYRDDSYRQKAGADIMDALHGYPAAVLEQREAQYKKEVEDATEMIAQRKSEGYSFADRTKGMTSYQRKKAWWDFYNENGYPPDAMIGESGIKHWQVQRKKALNRLSEIELAKKIAKRNEFAKKSEHYMPWNKNPNSENPSYKPWEAADEMSTEDGGPGSGNWGHRGRPGKVGGSGKGGGKQYRGGRSDIGYFSSRKDWLNGLSGERQSEAQKFIAETEKKITAAKKIHSLYEKNLITDTERDDALKRGGLEKIDVNASPEENILHGDNDHDKSMLLGYAKNAREWEKNKERLKQENLTEDERKVWEYLNKNMGFGKEEVNCWCNLTAKALDLPVSEQEIPNEVQYAAGVKERPAPPKPAGPDYSWFENGMDKTTLAVYVSAAIGESASYGHNYSRAEFETLNQKFVDKMKYGNPSPNELTYYGLYAINSMRNAMRKSDGGQYVRSWEDFKYTPEMYARLSEDEKKQLLDIVNRYNSDGFSPEDKFKNLEEITADDFYAAETKMRATNPRSKEAKRPIQDYILLQEKLMLGVVPSDHDMEAEEKEKREQEAQQAQSKEAERRKKEQAEFQKTDGAKRKTEVQRKVRDFDPSKSGTAAGITESFNKTGIFADGFELTKISDSADDMSDITRAYAKIVGTFPFLAGDFGSLKGKPDHSYAYGDCSKDAYRGEGEINVNMELFRDREAAKKKRKSEEIIGFKVKTDEDVSAITCTATHELGHALDNWLNRVVYGGKFPLKVRHKGYYEIREYYSEVSETLQKRTLRALKMKKADIKKNLSEYGATDAAEFFAECICENLCSSNPRPVAKELMNQLQKFIKENGIGDTFTSNLESMQPRF